MAREESLALLTAIAESTSDLIWAVEPERFSLLVFNQAMAAAFRRTHPRDLAVGLAPEQLFADSAEELANWMALHQRVLAEGNVSLEFQLRPDEPHWLFNLNLVRGPGGKPFGISGVGRNISALKRVERALQASESRFRTLIEEAPVALGISRQGTALYGNRKFLELYGLSGVDEVVGIPIAEQFAPESREQIAERLRLRSLGLPVSNEFEAVGMRKGGARFPVRVNVTTVELADGPATLGVLTDESARRKAEAALRTSEIFYRTMLETGQDVYLLMDAEAHIKFVSRSVARVFGWTEEDASIFDDFQLVHPDDKERVRGVFERVVGGAEECLNTTYRLKNKNGEWRKTFSSARNCLRNPEIGGVLVVLRDITEEAKREEELRQAQKMESVGQLAGGVAHDFNNLLTVILGNAEELLEDLAPDEGVKESLLQILSAGKRAAALTRQLLAFSRRQVLSPRVFDLDAAILDIKRMLGRVLKEDVIIEHVRAAEPMLIEADRGQIDQVLLNLAMNAGDAMPSGGRLRIEVTALRDDAASGEPDREFVALMVSDTGSGIAPEVMPRIFEPFFTTKEVGKGTGLGLATVYGIVEQSKGRIAVQSTPGQGTTFRVLLPRVDSAQAPGDSDVPQLGRGRGKGTIIVVEDDESLRGFIRRALEHCGFRVFEAANGIGAEALFEQREQEIDLVISDLVMPGMGGRLLAERLRRLKPNVKVLLMSGYLDDPSQAWSPDARLELLPKPFSAAELFERVQRMLRQQSAAT